MSQFKQITLVKKAELQLTSIDELTKDALLSAVIQSTPSRLRRSVDPLLRNHASVPTSTRVLMPNLFLTISTWGINVVLSDSLPAKTDSDRATPLVSD